MPTDVLSYHDLVVLAEKLRACAVCIGDVVPKKLLLAVQELIQRRRVDNTTHLAVSALDRRLSAMERLLGMD